MAGGRRPNMPVFIRSPRPSDPGPDILGSFMAGAEDKRRAELADIQAKLGMAELKGMEAGQKRAEEQFQWESKLFEQGQQDRAQARSDAAALAGYQQQQAFPGARGGPLQGAGAELSKRGPLGMIAGSGVAAAGAGVESNDAIKDAASKMSPEAQSIFFGHVRQEQADRAVQRGASETKRNLQDTVAKMSRQPGAEFLQPTFEGIASALDQLDDPNLTPEARARVIDMASRGISDARKAYVEHKKELDAFESFIALSDQHLQSAAAGSPAREQIAGIRAEVEAGNMTPKDGIRSINAVNLGDVQVAPGLWMSPEDADRRQSERTSSLLSVASKIQELGGIDEVTGIPTISSGDAMQQAYGMLGIALPGSWQSLETDEDRARAVQAIVRDPASVSPTLIQSLPDAVSDQIGKLIAENNRAEADAKAAQVESRKRAVRADLTDRNLRLHPKVSSDPNMYAPIRTRGAK